MRTNTLLKTAMVFIIAIMTSNAQVAVNTTGTAPNNFSMLDVSANQKGVLIPRIMTADRTTMAGSMGLTEEGLTVYDTDTQSFWFWNGASWVEITSSATSDHDWYLEGTTTAPSNINDKMFHLGQVAIGQNTANSQLDVYGTNVATLFYANQANPDNSALLRMAGSFNVGGLPTSTHGKIGVYSSVGGDPGTANNSSLEAYEAMVGGEDGVNKPQYAFRSTITGNNGSNHYGVYNHLSGGGTGVRFGAYNSITGNGSGIQYGTYNSIDNTGTEKKAGTFNEISSPGGAVAHGHNGTINLLGAKVVDYSNPINSAVPVTGDGSGSRVGTSNIILGDGAGNHVGEVNGIVSTGNGTHVGVSNTLGHDYVHNINTGTNGRHFGVVNNLTDTGAMERIGTANLLGVIANPNDPLNMTPVTGDGNAKRVGTFNTVGGDGDGNHYGVSNVIVSTGNGEHIGTSNVTGITPAGTFINVGTGNQVGTENVIGGIGNGSHYAAVNHIASIGDGLHIASNNRITGPGNGLHIASFNVVENNGTGRHIAVFGKVDSADPNAMAGVFVGDVTARNYITNLTLRAGNLATISGGVQNYPGADVPFFPNTYNSSGEVELKLIIRVGNYDGNISDHEFFLQAYNGTSSAPISTIVTTTPSDWHLVKQNAGDGVNMIVTDWVPFSGGSDYWLLKLAGNQHNQNIQYSNVRVLIRPRQN